MKEQIANQQHIPVPYELLIHGKRREIRTYAALRVLLTPGEWSIVPLKLLARTLSTRESDISLQLKSLHEGGYIKRRNTTSDTQTYVKEYCVDY